MKSRDERSSSRDAGLFVIVNYLWVEPVEVLTGLLSDNVSVPNNTLSSVSKEI